MKKKKKATKWIIFARVLLVLQLIASAMIFAMAVKTKMLPAKYIMFAAGGLLIMEFLVFALVHLGQNIMKPKASGYFKRGLGTFISILVIICSLYGTSVLSKVMGTLNDMTGNKNVMEDKIVVYVMKDDPAETIDDAKDYTFAYTDSYGYEETKETIDDINKKTDSTINTKPYASAIEMVDALYSGEVKAMILNTSYVSVITDTEGYEDFETKTKVLYAYTKTYEVEKTEKDVQVTKEPFVVYISGSDTRSKKLAKSRSDVNIIATVNTDTHEILLVSTPRDYFVPLSISGGAPDKLTHAGIYGIDVCMDTLGMLYDIDINYYFRINFGGFVKVIDALGGITVNSDYDFDSKNILGYHFNKGENYVNGEQALIFARERYAFQEGDRQRGKNQMEVIRGVVKKALSPEILTSYSSILSSLDGCFGTNITYEEIAQILQQQLTNGGDWTIVSYSVNGTGATEKPYSMSQKAYVMVPDYNTVDKAKSLMEKVRNGEVVTQEEADAPVGSTSESTDTQSVTEPGTVAAETATNADGTAADGATTDGAAATDGTTTDTTTQQ